MINLGKKILRKLRPYLPMSILRFIINLYFNRYYIKSYAQYGEDLVILDFFKRYYKITNLKRERGGGGSERYYLDIGSFHPKMISNTHLLYKNGWKGTAIDLDEFKLRLFNKNRKHLIQTVEAAVVPGHLQKKKYINVYKFNKPFSELDTLSHNVAKKIKTKNNLNYKKVKVKALGINNLLKDKQYDFVNIDVEGLDARLILSLDFKNINRPKLIVFESWNPLKDQSSYKFLKRNGYLHLFTSGGSVGFYCKKSIKV
jgi:hypothetical protein